MPTNSSHVIPALGSGALVDGKKITGGEWIYKLLVLSLLGYLVFFQYFRCVDFTDWDVCM